ncbi:MAG: hypothetical protein M0Z94_08000 [Dehalococcoidales bacterium]|nr:hypothetical protein [Dehalococcoidales bacterium]
MGVEIVLDEQDDIASVRQKVAAGGVRVALVVPANCSGMNRSLAFNLLRRYVRDFATDVVIVTRHGSLKRLASEYGFVTAPSTRKAEAYWRRQDALRTASPLRAMLLRARSGFVHVAGTLLLLAAGVGLVAYLALPVANVQLAPSTYPVSERVEVIADSVVTDIDSGGMRIPARVVRAELQASDMVAATGKVDEKARGFVTFGNLTDSEVRLAKGTIVTTADGRRFQTLAEAFIPSPRWTSARAEVEALEAGTKGEAARLSITKVEGPAASMVAVLNEQPIAVDKTRQKTTVTEEDRQKIRGSLLDRLTRQASAALTSQVKQHEILAPQSIKVDVDREEYDHKVGDEVTTLGLNLSVRATAAVFDRRQATELTKKAVEARLPEGHRLMEEGLTVGTPEILASSTDMVQFAVNLQGVAMQPIDEVQVQNIVWGKPAKEATVQLEQELGLSTAPSVTIEPEWAQRAYRVSISYAQSNNVAKP